jgi:hypothetical protein
MHPFEARYHACLYGWLHAYALPTVSLQGCKILMNAILIINRLPLLPATGWWLVGGVLFSNNPWKIEKVEASSSPAPSGSQVDGPASPDADMTRFLCTLSSHAIRRVSPMSQRGVPCSPITLMYSSKGPEIPTPCSPITLMYSSKGPEIPTPCSPITLMYSSKGPEIPMNGARVLIHSYAFGTFRRLGHWKHSPYVT